MSEREHDWQVVEEYLGIYFLIIYASGYGDIEMKISITKEQYDFLKQW